MSSTIQIRVDDELKIKSDKLFKELKKQRIVKSFAFFTIFFLRSLLWTLKNIL